MTSERTFNPGAAARTPRPITARGTVIQFTSFAPIEPLNGTFR
jgi:hypothetical protein